MKSSPARANLLITVSQAIKSLYTADVQTDRAAGSPEPELTAMARVLAYCLTFVRSAIAHGILDADFEEVVRLAREHEAEGWQEHRVHCVKCGGH